MRFIMNKTLLIVCLLAMVCLSGCSAMLAKTSQLSTSRATAGKPPERGLRVTEVFPDSPAAAAGIHNMDLITQYGEYPIVDDAGFFAARDHYERSRTPTVEIVVWRGVFRMSAMVRAGRLGLMTEEDDKVSKAFSALINRINSMHQIPEYMHDREFKGQFNGGSAKILEEAKALIDQAEREGTLTPAQVQVAQIYMILDQAPEQEQRRQAELLRQLFETQTVEYIHMLGNDKFFKGNRYRAAIACLNHYLNTSPDDISMRLNLAVAYNRVGMYNEAEGAADYVFAHNLRLSEHGQGVGYQSKAIAALGRKDYRNSIKFAEKAFAIEQDVYDQMLARLAAAQMGHTKRVEEAVQNRQEVGPAQFLELKLQIDAVDAYAMVKNNQRDVARKLVRMWKDSDRAEGRVIGYWRNFPDGMDVANNFADLMQN
jgi:tetratricopeptide (TPR) repeat protein